MTTRQLCARIAKRVGLKRDEVLPIFQALLEEVKEALERGENFHLPQIGEIYPGRYREQWWPRFRVYRHYRDRFKRNFVENRDANTAID